MELMDKILTESSIVNNNENKDPKNLVQKRGRGRPRKNQVVNEVDKTKKEKQTQEVKKLVKEITDKEPDEEIILHLPICYKDISTIKNNIFEKKTDSSPSQNKQDTNIFTINDINSDSQSNSSESEINDFIVQDLKEKIRNQDKIIKNLEIEILEYKALLNDNSINGVNNRKVTKMNIELIDVHNGKSVVCESTNIACWWCTHNFDTVPCFLPDKKINETYYVFGCFCSFNCAAAYNLNMNDSYIWNRYSLLKRLFFAIYNTNDDIILAPPREIFKKFGGPLSFDEFRTNCKKTLKEYRLIMPPMTSIIPLIEEGYTDTTKVNISLADLNKKTAVLKRTKPLPNSKNTLFETLGIKESLKK